MNSEEFKSEQTQKLTSIFEALDAETLDKEAVKTAFTSILEAQANYGFEQYKKKASQISKFEEVLGAIGYDQEKYQSVKDFAEKFKQEKTSIDETKSEKEQLIERIKRLEAEDAQRKAEADKLKAESERNKITTKLTEAIGDKLKGAKYIIKDLITEGKVKIVDGEVMFVNGDDVVLFDKGVESIFTENADLVVNKQIPGISTTKTKLDSNTNKTGFTIEEINKMTPDQLRANMSEIKKIAGVR